MAKPKILIADPISDIGIEELKADTRLDVVVQIGIKEADLLSSAHEYDGIIVRSQTKITAAIIEKASKLKAIGRAGVGVDNIDIPAATKAGVVVMNTPGGNTISTAEHAFTLMVSMARQIPQAHASTISGKWERKKFEGTEIFGKTLAILGLGRIGSEYAKRALAFGMKVVAYDPFLSAQRAQSLQVELRPTVEEAIADADFITLHMSMTKDTKNMLNATTLAKCKKGVRIINCARGGLVEETALVAALESGHVAGAAFDVYETEPPAADHPLFKFSNVVLTPHLGASTSEAQENVGIEIAHTLRDFLLSGAVVNAVNMPNIDPKTMEEVGPYLAFAETLGKIISQIAPAQPEALRINYSGNIGGRDTALISRAALKGYLSRGSETVNFLNSPSVAESRGLRFTESRLPGPVEYADLIEISVGGEKDRVSISGTFFGREPRLVKINNRRIEVVPEGCLLLLENKDMPGMVGAYGTLLGRHGVNIANMSLSRDTKDGTALVALTLDTAPAEAVMAEIRQMPNIVSAHEIQLGS